MQAQLGPYGIQVIINNQGFEVLSEEYHPEPNIATRWVTSCDYDGCFYLSSEQNGMEGFCIGGQGQPQSISKVWGGPEHLKLVQATASGALPSPPFHKVFSLNCLLQSVREIGRFSAEEAAAFYEGLDYKQAPDFLNFM